MPDDEQAGATLGLSEQELDAARWLVTAHAELGTEDTPGKGVTPRVVEYLKTVGMPADDEIAWCSAFMNWVFQKVGLEGSGKANARSWLDWGERVAVPRPGAVAVLWRENRESWKGHVSLFVKNAGSQVVLLGGNQEDRVCLLSYPRARVLGYRWPALPSA